MSGYLQAAAGVLLAVILVRMILLPMKYIYKIGIHSICGFVCLWLLNTIAPFTGIAFPMNAVTVLVAGTLGLPGIGLLAVLAVM